jgi:hypothetical protein
MADRGERSERGAGQDGQITVAALTVDGAIIPVRSAPAGRTPLGPVERQVLGLIDDRRTLGEISTRAGLAVHETATIIMRLVELGLAGIQQKDPSIEIPILFDDEEF